MPPRRPNSDIIIVMHVTIIITAIIIIAIIIIAIKYSTWTLAKLENIESGLQVVHDVGLLVHLFCHLGHALNRRDGDRIRGFEGARPCSCNGAGHDVLHVVDRGGLTMKLVVVVVKTLIL